MNNIDKNRRQGQEEKVSHKKKKKCEFLANLHSPCSDEGHQGEGDGEHNPEMHVLTMRRTSDKLKSFKSVSFSPGVLKPHNWKAVEDSSWI